VPPQGIRLTPRHYAYLKISEGCNNRCSFCIIPSMRGRLASRPIDEVLREAERLVAAGVKELLVISQERAPTGPICAIDQERGVTAISKRASLILRAAWVPWARGCACITSILIRTSTPSSL